jgi:glycosyltransferase involved in cell wall biosynthesis
MGPASPHENGRPGREARVALVGEWLAAKAGSEQVFQALASLLPTADLYALSAEPSIDWTVDGREVRTTILDNSVLRNRRAFTLPFMPLVWRYFRPGEYDLVVTSSHAAAKGFWPGRSALHLSYVHTPMRYAWWPDIDTRGAGRALAPARACLRRWDRRSARWVDDIATNSSYVAARIESAWGRHATVIPPPVWRADRTTSPAPTAERAGVVSVGRLVEYKRHDLAIQACRRLGVPLTVAGGGPDESRLRAIAADDPLIRFCVSPGDDELDALLSTAQALIFAGREDFGIVPIEASAHGTPVCALGIGGSLDTVVEGLNGFHFHEASIESITKALGRCLAQRWDHEAIAQFARRFSSRSFAIQAGRWIEENASQAGLTVPLRESSTRSSDM